MPPLPVGYDEYTTQIFFALFQLVVLSLVLERALFIAFDIKLWRERLQSSQKALITVAISIAVCWFYDFDIMARVMETVASTSLHGIVLTGLVVAGGSASAMRLMQDFLRLSRAARDEAKAEQEKRLNEASAKRDEAAHQAARAKANIGAAE